MTSEAEFHLMIESAKGSDVAFLTDLGPIVLAVLAVGMAEDTRSIARHLDVAHALVLRECNHLCDELLLISMEDDGSRSGRQRLGLTEKGLDFMAFREAAE